MALVNLFFQVLVTTALGASIKSRQASVSGTAQVHLDEPTGPSKYYAAGFIYGIPDTPDQVPANFYKDMKFKFTRAGGAQIPSRGWMAGLESYKQRWESALSNYKTAREHGGQFILLVHDLWGADGGQKVQDPLPGDNGKWDFYDEFLSVLISDLKENDMIDGLYLDIWNEPDIQAFWGRSQDQYLQMWGRGFHRFREELPQVPLTGPSAASTPSSSNTWWDKWTAYAVLNSSLPDDHSWHSLTGTTNTEAMVSDYDSLLSKHGATRKGGININEYGKPDEQTASGSAWWIAQLERANIYGLRANWASGYELHDLFAQLLGKPGAGTGEYDQKTGGYYPVSEYQVYMYYALKMTGNRVKTQATSDVKGDVYVTVDDGIVRVLAGTRVAHGTWSIQINGLKSLGLADAGTLQVRTIKFPGSASTYTKVEAPVNMGTKQHSYSDGVLSLPVDSQDVYTAWAFEIGVEGA